MDFIKDIHEARMTRNADNQRVLSYTDCCERLYLTMLVLQLLRQFPQFAPSAHGYAKKTNGKYTEITRKEFDSNRPKDNKANNNLFMLPFFLGIIGLLYQ